MAGEVLMSTRELGCRRTNHQAEKYLSKVIDQLNVEKHLVCNFLYQNIIVIVLLERYLGVWYFIYETVIFVKAFNFKSSLDLGPYSQKVLGLNIFYKSSRPKFKPKPRLSPFVNTCPGI